MKETDMTLKVTYEVTEHLHRVLERAEAPSDAAVRFVPSHRGVGLRLDRPHSTGDEIFEHAGRKVLVMEKTLARALRGKTLTMIELGDGRKRLRFEP